MPHRNTPPGEREGDPFTDREQEILALLAAGVTAPDIAARLGITLATVRNHTARIYTKIGAKPAQESSQLSARELEILPLLAAGHPTVVIAQQLGISPGTVKAHLTSIYRKIGAQNRVQATRYYLEHLAPPSDA